MVKALKVSLEPLELRNYFKDIYKCNRCGYCRETVEPRRGIWRVCPFREYTPEFGGFEVLVARGKLHLARCVIEGTFKPDEDLLKRLYACSLCGACAKVCPAEIDTVGVFEALEAEAVKGGVSPPPSYKEFYRSIEQNHNPYFEKHENRAKWVPSGLSLPKKADTVFFVGCTSSYRQPSIARSTAEILSKAGEKFVVMDEEWCCGSPCLRTGQREVIPELVTHNVKALGDIGAKRLVTSCASCYKVFKVDYPKMGVDLKKMGVELLHSSELMLRLINEKKLKLKANKAKVTYHDPCRLGRQADLYDPPRNVLKATPELQLVEMRRKREFALCCGAGGGVKLGYGNPAIQIAVERLREAEESGAEILISTCPLCKQNFQDAAAKSGLKVQVLDLTEMVRTTTK